MKLNKKMTDFIRLEEGNIGRKAAVVTGALLASGVLGAVLTSTAAAIDPCHMHGYAHSDTPHADHLDGHYDEYLDPCP